MRKESESIKAKFDNQKEGVFFMANKKNNKYIVKVFNEKNVLTSLSPHKTEKQAQKAFEEYQNNKVKPPNDNTLKTSDTVPKQKYSNKNVLRHDSVTNF